MLCASTGEATSIRLAAPPNISFLTVMAFSWFSAALEARTKPRPLERKRVGARQVPPRRGNRSSRSLHANRHFQSARKGQRQGAQTVLRIGDEGEVSVITAPGTLRIVGDDDGALTQVRRDVQHRGHHRLAPDVEQHEIDRTFDALERVLEIAFTQIDELPEPRGGKIAPRDGGFAGFPFGRDNFALA